MSLESDVSDIRTAVRGLRSDPPRPNRAILYTMVAIAMFGSIKSCNRAERILDNYQAAPQVQVQNVIGGPAPEKFYDLNSQRVYLEVDGKPVEQYFPTSTETQLVAKVEAEAQ